MSVKFSVIEGISLVRLVGAVKSYKKLLPVAVELNYHNAMMRFWEPDRPLIFIRPSSEGNPPLPEDQFEPAVRYWAYSLDNWYETCLHGSEHAQFVSGKAVDYRKYGNMWVSHVVPRAFVQTKLNPAKYEGRCHRKLRFYEYHQPSVMPIRGYAPEGTEPFHLYLLPGYDRHIYLAYVDSVGDATLRNGLLKFATAK